MYDECQEALKISIVELKKIIEEDEKFKSVGSKMLDSWNLSLDEKTYKEIPLETVRNWK